MLVVIHTHSISRWFVFSLLLYANDFIGCVYFVFIYFCLIFLSVYENARIRLKNKVHHVLSKANGYLHILPQHIYRLWQFKLLITLNLLTSIFGWLQPTHIHTWFRVFFLVRTGNSSGFCFVAHSCEKYIHHGNIWKITFCLATTKLLM